MILCHERRQENACGDSAQGSEESAGQGKACLFDMDMHKVDTHGIEDSFCATHHDGSGEADERICAMRFKEIQ